MTEKKQSQEPPQPAAAAAPIAGQKTSSDTDWPRLLARVVEGIVTAELHEFEDNVMAFLEAALADASATFIRLCAWVIGGGFLLTGLTLFAGIWLEWWAAFASVGAVVIALGSLAAAMHHSRRRRGYR
jgi:hypothetical protein